MQMQIQCKAILMVLKPSVNLGNDLENPDSLSGFFYMPKIFPESNATLLARFLGLWIVPTQ